MATQTAHQNRVQFAIGLFSDPDENATDESVAKDIIRNFGLSETSDLPAAAIEEAKAIIQEQKENDAQEPGADGDNGNDDGADGANDTNGDDAASGEQGNDSGNAPADTSGEGATAAAKQSEQKGNAKPGQKGKNKNKAATKKASTKKTAAQPPAEQPQVTKQDTEEIEPGTVEADLSGLTPEIAALVKQAGAVGRPPYPGEILEGYRPKEGDKGSVHVLQEREQWTRGRKTSKPKVQQYAPDFFVNSMLHQTKEKVSVRQADGTTKEVIRTGQVRVKESGITIHQVLHFPKKATK